MNFNLVEMYNGLLRFNKHIKKGVNHSDITIDNIQDKCYFIGDQANTNNFITEFDFRFGPYFVPNKVGTNKKLTIIG